MKNNVNKVINLTLNKVCSQITPAKKRIEKFINRPEVQYQISILKCKIITHPIYSEVLPPNFDVKDILSNWRIIRKKLYLRFPANLKNGYREKAYNQILKCQSIKCYIAVCRSVYPEIEALFRDEMLMQNEDWKNDWKNKGSNKARSDFLRQQLKELIGNKHQKFPLTNANDPIDKIGMANIEFLLTLEEIFQSFDLEVNIIDLKGYDIERKSLRHLHSHAFIKDASFINGLNAILTFDLALQFVSEKKKQWG